MLVGHYGIGFAAAGVDRRIALWAALLAAQLPDILFGCFVLLGIEHLTIVPGITASNPLDPTHFPYTHSLVAGLVLGGLTWVACLGLGARRQSATILAAVVVTHWLLDLPMHRAILPVYDDTWKVGLGLWNTPLAAFALEAAVLVAGLGLYLSSTATRPARRQALLIGAAMVIVHLAIYLAPRLFFSTSRRTVLLGLGLWLAFPAAAALLGRRSLRAQS